MPNKEPYVIGLTGGIASGKSEVTNYLKSQGYTVLDADQAYHQAMKKGGPAYQALLDHFGQKILSKEGRSYPVHHPWGKGTGIRHGLAN